MLKSLIITTVIVLIAHCSVFANDAQTETTKKIEVVKQDGKTTTVTTVVVPEAFSDEKIKETLERHAKINEQHAEIVKQHAEIVKQYAEVPKQHIEKTKQHAEVLKQHAEALKQIEEIDFAKLNDLAVESNETMRQRAAIDRQPVDEESRLLRRVEMQLKRMAEEFSLTEKQLEDAKKLFVEHEKMQNELREKLNELNKEKMDKFEELLSDEQKKLRDEKNSKNLRRTTPANPEEMREMRRMRLNTTPNLEIESETNDSNEN